MSPPKSKRRAPSPAQPGRAKVARTDTNGESKLSGPPEPPAAEPKEKPIRKDSNLSAHAPAFVPRSASASTASSVVHSPVLTQKAILFSPTKEKQNPNGSGQSKTTPTSAQTTLTPALFRPIFKSEPIMAKDSTFQARLFRLENTNTQRTRILGYMKRNYDAQHHMAAWRCLILKDGMSGLEGEHAFVVDAGCCDDGESRGGKTVMDVLEKSGLCDVLVVVSRW
ncbi:hypothetical protein BDV93DRAFT_517847 [Ceratobasidium sp. AG-I]|nr:hypothetical protein BDV93DRAFT_517847 [Ceratobasidium sp. AG-I]